MATLTVGSGGGFDYTSLASAVAASADGDVIQVQAGTYTNDFAAITTSITIEGVGGMVNLVATDPPLQSKGILIIGSPGATGPDVTLDNISFSGAAISNAEGGNGAGIRYQSGNLVLNNTYFHDNQDGLLADADPNGTITINNSEFINNGNNDPPSTGIEHNLYVGEIQQLTVNDSYFSSPVVGHDIKSRALNTTIENSRIDDPTGTGSYEIDLPNGGNAIIRNNVIEKGPGAGNNNFIAFGEESAPYAGSSLTVSGNTVINDYGANANLLLNDTALTPGVTGNTVYGLTASQIPSPASNTILPQSSEPALDTSAAFLPVLPFDFACFAEGTLILTDAGLVPVEALHVGQQVAVIGRSGDDPGAATGLPPSTQPIRWIGHRLIDLTRHADRLAVQPVRIRAGAFADGVPRRDLLVSPDHGIHVDGVLIPARLLLNDATILYDDRLRAIRYFHVELDRHAILLAENLPAESYLDTGNRNVFENAPEPLRLHPDLSALGARAQRDTGSCVPFAVDAARVEPVWRQLAARAVQLGHVLHEPETTADPALCLWVNGSARRPVTIAGERYVFTTPETATSARLVSRSAAPSEITPWIDDQRQLGVAVRQIVIAAAGETIVIAADNPSLTDGWWTAEHDGRGLWRWTNGNALFSLPPGPAVVEVHLAGKQTCKLATRTPPGVPDHPALTLPGQRRRA